MRPETNEFRPPSNCVWSVHAIIEQSIGNTDYESFFSTTEASRLRWWRGSWIIVYATVQGRRYRQQVGGQEVVPAYMKQPGWTSKSVRVWETTNPVFKTFRSKYGVSASEAKELLMPIKKDPQGSVYRLAINIQKLVSLAHSYIPVRDREHIILD